MAPEECVFLGVRDEVEAGELVGRGEGHGLDLGRIERKRIEIDVPSDDEDLVKLVVQVRAAVQHTLLAGRTNVQEAVAVHVEADLLSCLTHCGVFRLLPRRHVPRH